ncbi:hypothetical protein Clacol_009387 [Clathrus columnatus]|uniref:Protoporphyrinogen oxidase n=1 Tax=Clathrus columnatus TaxID=1419009 RepID=A0AAV5AMU4_9AGAM|nr:hypothetical protein Clacol_009387 [Clathrus columnatus]
MSERAQDPITLAPPSVIAVLGGGITGLSTTFHLTRKFPNARILLLEKSPRLGGWMQSKRVQFGIPGGDVGTAILETGPRSLRPNSSALLELINLLGLQSQLITTSEESPAAKNRFLYMADNQKPGLTAIPSNALGFLRSQLALTVIPAVLREPFRKKNRPSGAEHDESLDSLMSRRFGNEFARILGSSLVHGIYAADARKLSVKTALPPLWMAENRGNGSIIRGVVKSRKTEYPLVKETYDTGGLETFLKNVSVFSFKDGIQMLPDAITKVLETNPNVDIRTSVKVTKLLPSTKCIEISTPHETITASHVVTTTPPPSLEPLLTSPLPHLTSNPYSSVTVISFVFAARPEVLHPPGFGYLIPRPKNGYESDINPEGILGVVFDSCSLGDQDRPLGQFTKLTMMVGGPYTPRLPTLEDKDTLTKVLLTALERHLGRRLPRPAFVQISYQKDCIPTLTTGHLTRMAELREALSGSPWNSRMEVVGAGIGGVSVGDCVVQGRNAGNAWQEQDVPDRT